MKSLLVSKLGLIFLAIMAFSSCQKNETNEAEVESFAEETIFRMQEAGNLGRFGCYELSFPVTVTFPDGSVSEEVNSYDELRDVLKTWRADNGKARVRPVITLPFEVITDEGEIITVENVEQLRRLRMECRRTFFDNHGPNGHNDRGKFCFRLQFPLSLMYPDGTIESYTTRREMSLALRLWRIDNRGAVRRPVLVFPLNVIKEDGTVVTVNSKEELKALKEDCK
jgi:hypothetical protein